MQQLKTNTLVILRRDLTFKDFKTLSNNLFLGRNRIKVYIRVPQVSYFPSAKSAEISEDLFFNSRPKNYLSQYRRNEGSAALKNFFEKSTQPEVYLSFFGLSVAFLFVKWQLREAGLLMCKREVCA